VFFSTSEKESERWSDECQSKVGGCEWMRRNGDMKWSLLVDSLGAQK
jgi:hypothetical protein